MDGELENKDMGHRCGVLKQSYDCFKEGLGVMEEGCVTDACLAAELHYGMGRLDESFRK